MYLLFLYFPIVTIFVICLGGRFFGSKGVSFLTIMSLFCSLILFICLFVEVCIFSTSCEVELACWMFLNNFIVEWNLLYDSLSIIILGTVCIISLIVQIYATMYMSE